MDNIHLVQAIRTPVCLDETIVDEAVCDDVLRLGAADVINIKPGRVGGHLAGKRIHDACLAAGVPVWHGGMLETGIGRAANLALAALPGFTLPGDISAAARYWDQDIVTEPAVLEPDGTIRVPDGPGIGVEVDLDVLDAVTTVGPPATSGPERNRAPGVRAAIGRGYRGHCRLVKSDGSVFRN